MMARAETQQQQVRLSPEKIAYWYFRLNGFLQIENFVVHPTRRGSQRTDADMLGVRFPHRAEFLLDHPGAPMQDDCEALGLSSKFIDIVIAEVKTNQQCSLNGPWIIPDRQNVPRVLLAIGCVSADQIDIAAQAIYETGIYHGDAGIRVRLIAVGRDRNEELQENFPNVVQITWLDVLSFIWNRFSEYHDQKRDIDQWDNHGKQLKMLVENYSRDDFVQLCFTALGVRYHPQHDPEVTE